MNYKILFASLFDIITKLPSLSVLFFRPTLTPLLPHSPSQHSCHFIFPSHHYFHPILRHTTLLIPFSLNHSFYPSLHLTPLFTPHSPSTTLFTTLSLNHSFHPTISHTTLFTTFSLTLFTPFFFPPFFSLHSP